MQEKPDSKQRAKGAATATYQLKIVLTESEPPIWRRVQVPGTASLGWFHAVLQVAMGWTNSHLHHFVCGEHRYAETTARMGSFDDDPAVLDETRFTLADLLKDDREGLIYEYDFGDSWQHGVTLEKILPRDALTSGMAVCLEGSRACPPEDCGGMGGYMELLKALKNKKHPEHKSMKEWLGRSFDSELFDLAKTNQALRQLKWPRVTEVQLRKILMDRDDSREG